MAISARASVPSAAASPEAFYRDRAARFAAERDALTGRWNRLANLRLAVFVLAVVALIWGIAGWRSVEWARPLLFVGILLAGAFLWLAVYHRLLGRRRRRADAMWRINDEALKRLAHAWDELPLRHATLADAAHPYAVDLDIFGRASLMHLLEGVSTPTGEATLARWLLAAAPVETVRERQAAVAELTPRPDLRDELALRVREMDESRPDPEPFLLWADDQPWLIHRRFLRVVGWISLALLWSLVAAQLFGVVPYPLWLLPALANLGLAGVIGSRARPVIAWLWPQERAFGHYAALFALLSTTPFEAPALLRVQEELSAAGVAAHRQMKRLHRLTNFAIPFSAPFYWPIQALTLWDMHLLAALESWQQAAGRRARAWLAALGEAEALVALAGLAHDNPAWVLPEVEEAEDTVQACGLGHPLLPPGGRVVNDVEVGPRGSFLLVTGSNMSGKSTLLRAVGVNAVLAGAGGPVCASRFRAPALTLWTSMRVQDSLERGVSYFMAELQRLKAVVDGAREHASAGEGAFLYLLDEIMQGTNTAERQIAARRIIAELVRLGALGAVSTHDLTLADTAELAALARMIHFTETVTSDADGPTMTFDYTIRPGPATSSNALKLMEIVGLELGGNLTPGPSPARFGPHPRPLSQ